MGELMYIPIIQGTLKYGFIKDFGSPTPKDSFEGAVFASSVLPMVAACDADAAETIYKNMDALNMETDYAEMKKAFESVYDCMGITCEEVGGQWVAGDDEYEEGGEPCTSAAYGIESNIGFAI